MDVVSAAEHRFLAVLISQLATTMFLLLVMMALVITLVALTRVLVTSVLPLPVMMVLAHMRVARIQVHVILMLWQVVITGFALIRDVINS
jgi:hypothetical protein